MLTEEQLKFLKNTTNKYEVTSDDSIEVWGSVEIDGLDLSRIKSNTGENFQLPVKFKTVRGRFACDNCRLISFHNFPDEVYGDVWCQSNKITSLDGSPRYINGSFYCGSNQLTSLEGAPDTIGGSFHVNANKLTSLKGFPIIISGKFHCYDNPDLDWYKNYQYVPEEKRQGILCLL